MKTVLVRATANSKIGLITPAAVSPSATSSLDRLRLSGSPSTTTQFGRSRPRSRTWSKAPRKFPVTNQSSPRAVLDTRSTASSNQTTSRHQSAVSRSTNSTWHGESHRASSNPGYPSTRRESGRLRTYHGVRRIEAELNLHTGTISRRAAFVGEPVIGTREVTVRVRRTGPWCGARSSRPGCQRHTADRCIGNDLQTASA